MKNLLRPVFVSRWKTLGLSSSPAVRRNKAFSLVEMIVVIAVISFLTAVAVPALSRLNSIAKESVARRNAQYLATVSAAANADGAYHVFAEHLNPGGITLAMQNLKTGVVGEYTGILFSANLTNHQISEASRYLDIEFNGNYVLVYDHSGVD